MQTFLIRRRGFAGTGADIDAAMARLRALDGVQGAAQVRWLRSYVLQEADGRFGTRCVFRAPGAQALRDHAAAAGLPADEILAAPDTVVIRPDAPTRLYEIRRRNFWKSAEDLKAAAARSRHVGDTEMADKVSWIRSYVVSEPEGTLGTVCFYQAVDPQAIEEHAERVGMPAQDITPVIARILHREDPVVQSASAQTATA